MKPKHIFLFIIVNAILLMGIFIFGISPIRQNISRLNNVIIRQEAQIAMRTNSALDYDNNLQKLMALNENRVFLLSEQEVTSEFSKINQLVYANNLQVTNFVISEATSFYTEDEQRIVRTSSNIQSYGYVSDIINLLQELEDTSPSIMIIELVWSEDYRAIINIALTLLSTNI